MEIFFDQNDNIIELNGLRDQVSGSFINNATVTVTVKTAAGIVVTGETFPLAMNYVVSSNGKYSATLKKELAVSIGTTYYAEISVAASGVDGFWTLPFGVSQRVA